MYQYGYKLEKALDILDQSQGLEMLQDAEDGSFYLLKFDLLFELERYDEALVILNKIDSEEQNVLIEVLVRRGDVCAKLLQKEKSMRFWMDARTMGGNSKKLIEKIETGRYVE